jgi:hypothetical protein
VAAARLVGPPGGLVPSALWLWLAGWLAGIAQTKGGTHPPDCTSAALLGVRGILPLALDKNSLAGSQAGPLLSLSRPDAVSRAS